MTQMCIFITYMDDLGGFVKFEASRMKIRAVTRCQTVSHAVNKVSHAADLPSYAVTRRQPVTYAVTRVVR